MKFRPLFSWSESGQWSGAVKPGEMHLDMTYMNGCKLRILNSNFSLFLTQDYHLTFKDSLNILKLFALYVVKKNLFNFGYCKFYKIVQYGKTSLNIPLKIFFFLYSCFVPWKKVVRV